MNLDMPSVPDLVSFLLSHVSRCGEIVEEEGAASILKVDSVLFLVDSDRQWISGPFADLAHLFARTGKTKGRVGGALEIDWYDLAVVTLADGATYGPAPSLEEIVQEHGTAAFVDMVEVDSPVGSGANVIYRFGDAYFVFMDGYGMWDSWLETFPMALESLYAEGRWVSPGTSLTFNEGAPEFISEFLSAFRVFDDGSGIQELDIPVNDGTIRFSVDTPPRP